MKKFILSGFLAAALLVSSLLPSAAHATTVNGLTVQTVSLDGGAGMRLKILASDGNWYYAFMNASGGCSGVGADVVKVWESLATSAFLSGRHLNLYFDTTCGSRNLNNLDITN